jgi:hypothetical protein
MDTQIIMFFNSLQFNFLLSFFLSFVSHHILSYPILSYPILSNRILSYLILSYPILSYPILSNRILSYPTPFYTIPHNLVLQINSNNCQETIKISLLSLPQLRSPCEVIVELLPLRVVEHLEGIRNRKQNIGTIQFDKVVKKCTKSLGDSI